MTVRLLLAPAAAGKTFACLERIRACLQAEPLAPVWVVVPDRHQAIAFRQRLAEHGGGLGVYVGTFGDLYTEILALAGRAVPVVPEAVRHRLLRAAIDEAAARGELRHYLPIRNRPGLTQALGDLVAELKRARVEPVHFAHAARRLGRRLDELAALYSYYQAVLLRVGWADDEGLGWLAVEALRNGVDRISAWKLLVADGFDSFNPTQLQTLRLLAGQVAEILLTLCGEPNNMERPAYRRFTRTLEAIQWELTPLIGTIPAAGPDSSIRHLGARLFETDVGQVPADGRITFLEARTPAQEAREALRWLKARIIRDGVPPRRCAVTALDIGPYRQFLRSAAREFGLEINFAGGEPLAENPAIAAVLNLLGLPVRNWPRRPVVDAVRSPYFDLQHCNLRPADAPLLEAAAHWGQVIEGPEQWDDTLARLSGMAAAAEAVEDDVDTEGRPLRPPTGPAAVLLRAGLAELVRRTTPPPQGTIEELVVWVEDLLQDGVSLEICLARHPDTAGRDLAALAKLREILRALVMGEKITGQPRVQTYADFYSDLRGAVEAAAYQPDYAADDKTDRIYAANLTAVRGVIYSAVAVLGLAEGLFPAPVVEDPFLSDDERQTLSVANVPLELRRRSDQQTLFYEAVTRAADYLLLSRPYLADDGEEWEPSPYWTAALELCALSPRRVYPEDLQPLTDAASPEELLIGATSLGSLPVACAEFRPRWEEIQLGGRVLRERSATVPAGIYEGNAAVLGTELAAIYGSDHVWSSSRLEAYGVCPFMFFLEYVLRLELREMPQPGCDSRQLGLMLHKILEELFAHAEDPADEEAVLAALPPTARRVFDAAPQDYGFRPTPLWERQRAELEVILADSVSALAKVTAGFRPVCFEAAFGLADAPPLEIETAAGRIRLHGIIDRVDRAEAGGLCIIDYKSGSSGLAPRDLVEGRRLQLPLYALAAERVLRLGRPVEGFYWKIQAGEAGSLRLSKFEYQAEDGQAFLGVAGAEDVAVARVGAFVQGIRQGAFPPVPRTHCPPYCPGRLFCWRYAPADY